jgi:hypothetical protein
LEKITAGTPLSLSPITKVEEPAFQDNVQTGTPLLLPLPTRKRPTSFP